MSTIEYSKEHLLITDTLLHLQFRMLDLTQKFSMYKKNKLILEFLKKKVKQERFSFFKKEVKLLKSIANKNQDLSVRLQELYDSEIRYVNYRDHTTDFQTLLLQMKNDLNIKSVLKEVDSNIDGEVLIVSASSIQECFTQDTRQQVLPIEISYFGEKIEELKSLVEKGDLFNLIDVKQSGQETLITLYTSRNQI